MEIRTADRPGDLGWVVMTNAEAYAAQYDWDTTYEHLVLRIVADYTRDRDPGREAAWIAEVDGHRVGCIFLVHGEEEDTARLRLLLVTQEARGLGAGTQLVDACLSFAREVGYERVVLWTNSVLGEARRIYERAGFELVDEEPHHSFGHDLIGQTWSLTL